MSLDHTAINCGKEGCGAVVWMTSADLARRERTHETWYCPNGHPRAFLGKTAQEKKIERLTAEVEWYEGLVQELQDTIESVRSTCTWTGCGFVGSSQRARTNHMIRAHGMPSLAAVREAS